ncbi:hypothetical protein [Rubrivirga sp. IMCC45206]|uniref:hypothetical protein n=1 Tax=Rubrivirga sp. IMCC45206 TaxID=3391614 RepID=UPI003990380B
MTPTLRSALIGAMYGSVAVVGAFGLMVVLGMIPKAPFTAQWQELAGGGWLLATVLGGLTFVAIGTLWGAPFAWVPRPTMGKAWLWAIVPTLWAVWAWPALTGKPTFAGGDPVGLLIPVVMNVVIWGSILGWVVTRAAPSPAS